MNNIDFDHMFRVLLLGDSGVGKSCLILRYTENQFNSQLMSSIGVDFKLKYVEVEGKKIKMQIWDTAGQERFRTITTSYYRGANAIAIVYDITDRESFEHVQSWMVDIEKYAKENVLKFLVGNKCDLKDNRKVSEEEGKQIAKLYNIPFIETSAKEIINIDELFKMSIKFYLDDLNSRSSKKVVDINSRRSQLLLEPKIINTKEENIDNCCLK